MMWKKTHFILTALAMVVTLMSPALHAAQDQNSFENPIIWADVPDPDVIRVGGAYYMTSTTMHMNPGVPIMKSYDLVNWEIVNYVYDTLGDSDAQALRNGQNEYGKGSWASSLRYHNGTYYVVFSSSTAGNTFIYKTRDIEKGPWTRSTIGFYHDMSLLFDDDGRVYLVHGSGDIRITELNSDASAVKAGGLNQVIIPNASQVAGSNIGLPAEGAHIQKINGKYYIFLITWPQGKGRTQLVYRADRITGPYEGRVALDYAGVAQGGIVDTPDGNWYGMLFQDHGSVGRTPFLVPVAWQNDWPVFGVNGQIPAQMPKPVPGVNSINKVVASDEFEQTRLPLVWQWNHNPDNNLWSLTERPGFIRLKTGRTSTSILDARNSLTQRSIGPESSGRIAIDVSQMKSGDYAGLAALQKNYGFVGVKMSGNSKSIVMVNGSGAAPVEVTSVPLAQDKVYLKVEMDFKNRTDKAYFYYSLDGNRWTAIGNTLQMSYTLPHFMGYRFALFNYATQSTGGYVDFDYFRIDNRMTGTEGSGESPQSPVQSGSVYKLRNAHSSMVIGISAMSTANGGQAVQWNDNGSADHQWRFDRLSSGYYKLTNIHSGKVLGIENMSTANGASAVQWDDNGTADHEWQLAPVGDGSYKLVNRHSGKVLGVDGMSPSAGAKIVQWDDNGTADHNWSFIFIR